MNINGYGAYLDILGLCSKNLKHKFQNRRLDQENGLLTRLAKRSLMLTVCPKWLVLIRVMSPETYISMGTKSL